MNPVRHRGDREGHRRDHPRGRGRGSFDESHRSRHPRRGGRAHRGDVRTAVLLLLAEEPMHGYQLMQAIGDRTGGAWRPSPGAVYPTISQLEDEGFVTVVADAGRRLVTLTDSGREHLAEHRDTWGDPFAGYDATAPGADLRRLVHELVEATHQVGRAGTDGQRDAAAKILSEARRSIYLLLADGTTDESAVS